MRIFICFFLLSFTVPVAGQEHFDDARNAARDSIQRLMKRSSIPGLAITVSVDGKIVWSEGFGYADLENQVKVDPATSRFRIGSISKSLTAAALGRLYERHHIIPDSSIYFYLPDYPRHRYRPTVRQVAGHLAGIRHYRGTEFFSNTAYTTVEAGLSLFKNDTLLFQPGTKYQYTSYGYNLLSAVLEKAAGEDFLSFMQKEVFDPLGMMNTCADKNDSIIYNRTRFYENRNGSWQNAPHVDNSCKWAGGGFISSSRDICSFANALLGNDYLRRETISTLLKPQLLNDGTKTGYGMGFDSRKDMKGIYYFGHSGGSVGGTSHMVIYPETRVVVVILTNLSGAHLRSMAHHIAHLYISQ